MSRDQSDLSLASFARVGFLDLTSARAHFAEIIPATQLDASELFDAFLLAADPDAALMRLIDIAHRHPGTLAEFTTQQFRMLTLLFGASPALGDFFLRKPRSLRDILQTGGRLISPEDAREQLMQAVGANGDEIATATLTGDEAMQALRVRYRELLAELLLFDLTRGLLGNAAEQLDSVALSLSDLADAVFVAALAVARANILADNVNSTVTANELASVSFSVIAMGKCGAEELNVVSDVDVMFIADAQGESTSDVASKIGTKLASELMRVIHDPGLEPPLWQVDPNLRPEGKQGPLVRSLSSMLTYYQRWAKTWEFQALLKARHIAGDETLGNAFVEYTRPLVWASSSREDFVGNVQRMREQVTEHIDPGDLEYQLKLGPGGLRDIEFSVQLLQLVHGQYDSSLHDRATLRALDALVNGGYVGRADGEQLASHYRWLRVLEHRLQMTELRRTALMPRDEQGLRVLARSSRFAANANELESRWHEVKREVRDLHLKIFYAPLLNAIASITDDEISLDNEKAQARIASLGFTDAKGAMRHLASLTHGNSRNARIQRNLLPVLLQWLAAGTDPDFGLIAFRRISEAHRDTPWYLRLLRDGTLAAERLTSVISRSRYAADLIEQIPESVAWLEKDSLLQPVAPQLLQDEIVALMKRRTSLTEAAEALRSVHRREILRLALGRLVFVLTDDDVSQGLNNLYTVILQSLLTEITSHFTLNEMFEPRIVEGVRVALIAMGRFGGKELGFSSDVDLMAVYEASTEIASQDATQFASKVITELQRIVTDHQFDLQLDFDLRPEGKSGPIVRSIDAYHQYYDRWSLAWESQALLRARFVAGDENLGTSFMSLVDSIRYSEKFPEGQVREIRRMKARVESERLPKGVEPTRHLKLGPGGISDVEWLVQLFQLQYAHNIVQLRTTSTREAINVLVANELLSTHDAETLLSSWRLASSIRSAIKLWSDREDDSLPLKRTELEGISGVLGLPPGQTTELEEQWLAVSRKSRSVFERLFFGFSESSVTSR